MKIIAEVGSNFKSIEHCLRSVEKAASAGANAVKFQLFTAQDLYGPNTKKKVEITLDPAWLQPIHKACIDNEIEFMCTAFSTEGYLTVNPLVKTHKIASAEMTHPDILDRVNKFKKPTILSTAGADFDKELKPALSRLKNTDVTIMFCVGDYPAKVVDFNNLRLMRQTFGAKYDYGYSDHSIDVLIVPVMAKWAGASIIEKHVNFVGVRSPDSDHSLNEIEFRLMVQNLRDQVHPRDSNLAASQDMKRLWRRRLVAMKDISEGQDLYIESSLGGNVGIYRPAFVRGNPLSAFDGPKLYKAKASRLIKQGEAICEGDFVGL